jgi:hypothetical protein
MAACIYDPKKNLMVVNIKGFFSGHSVSIGMTMQSLPMNNWSRSAVLISRLKNTVN